MTDKIVMDHTPISTFDANVLRVEREHEDTPKPEPTEKPQESQPSVTTTTTTTTQPAQPPEKERR
jgi:hypothetical protein